MFCILHLPITTTVTTQTQLLGKVYYEISTGEYLYSLGVTFL